MNHRDRPSGIYTIFPSNRYEKDIRRLKKSGANLNKLDQVIDMLSVGKELPDKYRDHELKGLLNGTRGCHIAPDWLLLYKKNSEKLILLLLRTGSHRDVLEIE